MSTSRELKAARALCPKCMRKGLGYAPHPHAMGYKSYNRASCRFCFKTFAIRPKQLPDPKP